MKVRQHFRHLDTRVVEIPAHMIGELAADPDVSYLSPDREVQSSGHVSVTTGADAARPSLLPGTTSALDGSGVGIAVLDSGIYTGHMSFKGKDGVGRVAVNVDFTGARRMDLADTFGHGTHVAGLAAGNSALYFGGYTGIAPNSKLINLAVLNALDWVLNNRTTHNIHRRAFPGRPGRRAARPCLNEYSFSMMGRPRSGDSFDERLVSPMIRFEKAAVLGAGTMGAQIAAHLANAGVPTLLLDIAPKEPTAEESAKGLTVESREVRDRAARAGLEAAKKAKPAAFFTPERAALVRVGNFEDDLQKLKDCDLIVEAVVENLEIKRRLFEQVEKHRRPGSVVASNTSGIPIRQIAEGFSEDFRAHFLGMHFFNPPRYLHLVELIRTEWTKPEVSCAVYGFLDQRLGKGVVVAKDRPNFIANRIGTYGGLVTVQTMLEDGYSIEEVDKMTGQAVGRPKTATFRLFDLVGLDVFAHVAKNLYEAAPEDEDREVYNAPEFVRQMVERGMLGNKTKGGFYRRQKGEGGKQDIWVLDHATLEYKPSEKVKLPALDAARNIEDTRERVRALVWGKDRAGQFLWKTSARVFAYAANRIPEIADTVVEVDRAMKWGFGWELGVFETWDAVGVEKSVARMKEEGLKVPENVRRMLDAGATSFYKKENGQELYFDFAKGEYAPVAQPPGVIILKSLKDRTGVIKKNAGASLVDLGDGVACLEFHSKMNSIGSDTLQMVKHALSEVEKNFVGLVVGNQGQNFSVGANLMLVLMGAQEEEWDEIDLGVRQFQQATMSLRHSPRPVVVAPFQMTFGGGCEMTLHADRVRASAETYIGLVEVGVGLIPAGGGTKEMLVRALDSIPPGVTDADPFPFVKRAFETIALAKVATSAAEAQSLGFLRGEDSYSMNADRLIADAKQEVLALAATGYAQPAPRTDVLALGNSALATLKLGIHQMKRGGYISDYDALIGEKLARILTGGDLNHETRVSEQYLLDLEREAFLSLCGQRQTQERIAHMLKTGKPLRN